MAEEKITLTKEGLAKLEEEYRHLIDIDRPEVIEQLQLARSQGDLSENADYDAARNRQAQIEGRITEIEHIRDIAVIVEGNKINDSDTIGMGSVFSYVEVVDGKEVGDIEKAKLVGSVESDPFAELPQISIESPLARAVTSKGVGDIVHVELDEPYSILIKELENSSKAKKVSKKK